MTREATGMHFEVFEGSPQEATEKANAYLHGHDMEKEPVTGTTINFSVVGDRVVLTILMSVVSTGPASPIAVARMHTNGVPN